MAHLMVRRFFVALALIALIGTGFAQATMAVPVASSDNVMTMSDTSEAPMPCCPEKAPPCVTDMGCVFMIGIPAQPAMTSTPLSWLPVTYPEIHDSGEGLSLEPELTPPIYAV